MYLCVSMLEEGGVAVEGLCVASGVVCEYVKEWMRVAEVVEEWGNAA